MPFDNYHLSVRQLISPQNVWCLSLTRKIYPSHMMWHNLWTQTQNISADVNTFSFHFLNTADQAKFHFTEKATFFALWVEERNSEGLRHDSWVSLCLDCNLCIFQLKTSLDHKHARQQNPLQDWICCSGASAWAMLTCLPSSHCSSIRPILPEEVLLKKTTRVQAELSTSILVNYKKILISGCRVPTTFLCKSVELMFMINVSRVNIFQLQLKQSSAMVTNEGGCVWHNRTAAGFQLFGPI